MSEPVRILGYRDQGPTMANHVKQSLVLYLAKIEEPDQFCVRWLGRTQKKKFWTSLNICRYTEGTFSHHETRLYNPRALNPTFSIVKLGFTGVNIIFLLLENIDCGYSLEPPRRGGSNE